jgi:hypothetical protein
MMTGCSVIGDSHLRRPGGGTFDLRHMTDDQILAHGQVRAAWGLALAVDLEGCSPTAIRSRRGIARFAQELCELIEVKRYGPATVVRFGEDPRVSGYSLVQLIETSLVSGHFAEATNAAYIDVFSCKPFPPQAVEDFCRSWFEASSTRVSLSLRGRANNQGSARRAELELKSHRPEIDVACGSHVCR